MGGWTWTFVNGKWTYVIDSIEPCENDKDCGLFLEVSYDGTLKSRIQMESVK